MNNGMVARHKGFAVTFTSHSHPRSPPGAMVVGLLLALFSAARAAPAGAADGDPAEQPSAAKPPPSDVEAARHWMKLGVAHYAHGEWQAAREAFLKAWEEKQHYAVAANLAEVELRLGLYLEAAAHLRFSLEHLPADRLDERNLAEEQLEECRKHLAALRVKANVDGATVLLDGGAVGRTPLTEVLFAEPGRPHRITLERAGYQPQDRQVQAGPGEEAKLDILLQSVAPPPAPQAPAPAPAAARLDERSSTSARTWALLGGGSLTLVALGFGVGFSIKTASAREDVDQAESEVDTLGTRIGITDGSTACSQNDVQLNDACARLHQRNAELSDARSVATASWVLAGVLGATTVAAYWLLPGGDVRATAPSGMRVAPRLGPGFAGVEWGGRF